MKKVTITYFDYKTLIIEIGVRLYSFQHRWHWFCLTLASEMKKRQVGDMQSSKFKKELKTTQEALSELILFLKSQIDPMRFNFRLIHSRLSFFGLFCPFYKPAWLIFRGVEHKKFQEQAKHKARKLLLFFISNEESSQRSIERAKTSCLVFFCAAVNKMETET